MAEGGVVFLCSELAHRGGSRRLLLAATIAAAGQLGGGGERGGWVLEKMSVIQSHPQPNLWAEKSANIDFLPFADYLSQARLQMGGYKLACGDRCHVFKSKFCH